ncbi:cytoplasmic protein, partial [Terribacillus saccharophilus]|nr:cytoplasmic protein [Terribacillus saccharophilus]
MNLSEKAKEVLYIYKSNPNIETVFIGGSVSRNWQDDYSDIEIFVLWRKAPTDAERQKPIALLSGEIIDFFPYEDEEWSETYISQGVKLEISNFLTETISKVIEDVLLSFDTCSVKQCLLAAIHDGISLSGDSVMEILKQKVRSYPT